MQHSSYGTSALLPAEHLHLACLLAIISCWFQICNDRKLNLFVVITPREPLWLSSHTQLISTILKRTESTICFSICDCFSICGGSWLHDKPTEGLCRRLHVTCCKASNIFWLKIEHPAMLIVVILFLNCFCYYGILGFANSKQITISCSALPNSNLHLRKSLTKQSCTN